MSKPIPGPSRSGFVSYLWFVWYVEVRSDGVIDTAIDAAGENSICRRQHRQFHSEPTAKQKSLTGPGGQPLP